MGNSIRNIKAVAGRELRSYFASPVAWVTLALFAFIFGRFFVVFLDFFLQSTMQQQMGGPPQPVNINQQMIRGLFGNTTVLILFLLPMVTMRSYSEEKRSGTIELLFTSPLTDAEIVFGKFLGALGLYGSLLLVTVVDISILFLYGNPEWKPLLAGYLGLALLGASFISLGLFISSTTKNQMVAGIATFVVFLLFWIMDWSADSAGPFWGDILKYLSITGHFDDFAKGVIDTKHVIFYLSFISFGLFLTLKSVDSERWRG